MTARVLASAFKFALEGDMKAARLYLDMVGNGETQMRNNTFIETQNNFIQINKTIISQDIIKRLNPEQLEQIENIITPVMVPIREGKNWQL